MAITTGVKDAILEMKDSGLPYKEIAATVGCAKSTVSYHLGPKTKVGNLERQRQARATLSQWLREYKESQPCTDCGNHFPYYVMDFDHLGDKANNVSRLARGTGGKQKLMDEIAKCELVCANCHRVRSHNRGYGASTKGA